MHNVNNQLSDCFSRFRMINECNAGLSRNLVATISAID